MTLTLDTLAERLRPHHDEICIVGDMDLVRLVGVGADDDDLYYIVQDHRHEGPGIVWFSAVGAMLPLKGRVPEEDYRRMENIFTLNGCAPTGNFRVEDESVWDRDISTMERRVSRCGRFSLTFDPDLPGERFTLWRDYPDDPGRTGAPILRGEDFPLSNIAQRMILEMRETEEQDALAEMNAAEA
jgi:hypothetical protein